MAFTGRATYTNYYDEWRESLFSEIALLSPRVTPLLDIIGDGAGLDQPFFSWTTDKLNAEIATVSTVAASVTTGIVVSSTGMFKKNDIWQVTVNSGVSYGASVGEQLRVTSTTATTIYFSRIFGGSSAVTIMANANLERMGRAALEGEDFISDRSTKIARVSNYAAIFTEDIQMSMSELSIKTNTGESPWDRARTKRMIELMRDLEKTVLRGRISGNTLGTDSAPRYTAGLLNSITTNAYSLGTITVSGFRSILRRHWNSLNEEVNVLAMPPEIFDEFADLNGVVPVNNNAGVVQRYVQQIDFGYGMQTLIKAPAMPAKTIIGIQTSDVQIRPFRPFEYKEKASVGDYKKAQIVGEYLVQFNEMKHLKVSNVSV